MAPAVTAATAPRSVVSASSALDLQRARTILESRKRDALLMDLGRLRDGWATGDPTQGLFAAASAFLSGDGSTDSAEVSGNVEELRAQPLTGPARRDPYQHHKRELAASGNVEAMLWMGDFLSASLTPADQTEATAFFREAAKCGNADAMYKLAECHFRGRGLPRDEAEAVKWLLKAHEAGNPRATDVLATCYAVGTVLPKDHARAAQLYREAIDRGNQESLGNLGFLYLTADGLSPDEGEAYRLFRQGAQEEELWSMVISALCLEHGVGTPANPGEARTLFVKAARLGHPGAIRWCNVHGVGI
jgi:TPR repeat protein